MPNDNQTEKAPADSPAAHGSEVCCPECKTNWKKDCEQAIRVELFGICIACACDKKVDMRTAEVIHERVRRLDAQKIHHDYDLRDYPLNPPNAPAEPSRNEDARKTK